MRISTISYGVCNNINSFSGRKKSAANNPEQLSTNKSQSIGQQYKDISRQRFISGGGTIDDMRSRAFNSDNSPFNGRLVTVLRDNSAVIERYTNGKLQEKIATDETRKRVLVRTQYNGQGELVHTKVTNPDGTKTVVAHNLPHSKSVILNG